jgi:hypothetical protein
MTAAGTPAENGRSQAERGRVSPEQAEAFARVALKLSRPWTIAMVVVAVISAVDFDRRAGGGVSLHIEVDTATLAAIALIWLPAVLRLLSLTGGGVKAFGIEASTGGLANADALVVGLAEIRTQVEEVVREMPDAAPQVHIVEATVDRMASSFLGDVAAQTSEALATYARRYESIRQTQPPSRERTIAMNQLLNEARVRARAAPEQAARMARDLVRSNADGDRVVGLALLEQYPAVEALPDILRCVENSRSAFEQYHAIRTLKATAPLLTADKSALAASALERELADPRGVGVMDDPFIPDAIDSTLHAIEAEAARRTQISGS